MRLKGRVRVLVYCSLDRFDKPAIGYLLIPEITKTINGPELWNSILISGWASGSLIFKCRLSIWLTVYFFC